MAEYVEVANAADLPVGAGKAIEVRGKPIAVFNVGGSFHAIDNVCKHRGGSLGDGTLDDNMVTCPLHMWRYDVTTGQCETVPGEDERSYQTMTKEGKVYVLLD
ncbi:Rieske 2Fe-2S domain-containing protein [Candidatus Micrarchaeota archaeon]|nr:Rieske 2Fe-2S domain-containing protein [Candidatus Micrarchaeota archaeon]